MPKQNQKNETASNFWKKPFWRLFISLTVLSTIPMIIVIATISFTKWGILFALFTACLLNALLAHDLINQSSNHLHELNQWIHEVAAGQLEKKHFSVSNTAIQGVFFSFQMLVNHLMNIRDICASISKGDYSKFFSEPPLSGSIEAYVDKIRHKVKDAGLVAERHLNFLNNVPVPIIILNRQLELEYMNLAAETMFHAPISKCLGVKCQDLLKADYCKTGDCKAQRALVNDVTLTTVTNLNIEKAPHPVRYTNVPIHNSEGDIVGVMKFIMDISREMKLVHMAERISKGDYSVEIETQEEDNRLSAALNQMTKTLREVTEENKRQSWTKTGQTELNLRLRGEQDIQTLSENIIFYLCDYLQAPVGTFYVENDTKLRLVASYAYTHRKTVNNEFEMGESLIGQAALERKMIIFNELPDGYMHMQSGLGKEDPGALAVIPLIFHDKVLGVMEFGAVRAFTQIQVDFLQMVSETIAVAVNTAKARTRMSTLLAHSQNQSEELKVQQEELRQAYEDLEEQTKRLQNSEASLQQQHEELTQTNKALEKQTQLLEQQKQAIWKKNEALEKQQAVIQEKAKDLEIANKYKSEFLANMSHELRTPLNSILLLSGIIAEDKDSNLTEKQKEFAHTINMCGTDLLNLINEVLDLSKVESGKMELYPDHFYIQDVISVVTKTFEPVANQKQLDFNIHLSSELPAKMFNDQQRLEQILKNILSNAFKFTSQGEISLSIKRPQHTKIVKENYTFTSDQLVLFEISDTGIGIPKDKQKQVFEAFQQGDGTTKRRYGGTGLGLSIVKRMVTLMGGQVSLESAVGKGSTFSLVLPENMPEDWPHVILPTGYDTDELTKAIDSTEIPPANELSKTIEMEDESDSSETPEPEIDSDPSPDNQVDTEKPSDSEKLADTEKSIMIVTQNDTITTHLVSIVEKQKYTPRIVNDPAMALTYSRVQLPSGIILDLGLPHWTCWLLYMQLQQDKKMKKIPLHWVSSLHLQPTDNHEPIFFIKKDSKDTALQSVINSMNSLCDKTLKTALIVCEKHSHLINQFETEFSMTCTHQSDILEASQYLADHSVDALFLDLSFKELQGITDISKLAQSTKKAKIPSLLFTDADIWDQEWIFPVMDESGEIQQHQFNVIERMTDETLLFFHRLKKTHAHKTDEPHLVHDRDAALKGKKFLLVDDDMRNVFAISSVLEARGATVIVGRNGNEGMKCLDENQDIDLVLMDIMMPEMDGYEAITTIRNMPEYKKLPIIALTAKAMKKDRDKCIQAGADDYMPKPVYPDKLISMLRLWLNR